LHTVVHKGFRARRAWRALAGLAGQPAGLRRRHLRQAAALLYHAATLPLARRRLDRLARLPHTGTAALPAELDRAAAATPSPQPEQP
jgi:hypothetical protein